MALNSNLLLQAQQQAIAANRPFQSLLGGFQAGQGIAQRQLMSQLQADAARRAQQLAPIQAESLTLQNEMMQRRLGLLGVPDETTAKQFAFDAARLSALPDDQVLSAAQGIRDKAIKANRTTNNIDQFISTFERDPVAGRQLLGSFVTASERAGFLDSDTANTIKQQQLDLREKELALKQTTEQRQAGKLSAAAEKALISSQDAAIQSGRNATEFDILANQIQDAGLPGGVTASFEETAARFLGTQDDATELRRRFNKVRLSEGLKNLPPGPATDRDVQEAFKGVPPENAPASQMVSFLRGAAKMAKFDQAFNEFRSEYISENGNTKGLIKAWKTHAESISDNIVGAPDQAAQRFVFNPATGQLEPK